MPSTNQNISPVKVNPVTCADNFWSLGESPSTMAFLQNLVPAPDSAQQWVPRPAATLLANSAGTLPGGFDVGFVSCMIVAGDRVYGMMASNRSAGKDEPFAYDILGGAYLTITGTTASNTPTSPASTGTWTPPHAELIGTRIIITHTGYDGVGSNFFGQIDITDPSALAYSSSNTATNALPSVPVWVSQFNNRAYYYCNPANAQPALLLSDVIDPLTRSNTAAAYTLTLDDNVLLLCGGVFSVTTELGGQIATLFVFKQGAGQIYMIKGDPAATATTTGFEVGPIAISKLHVSTGTFSSNTVTATPQGLSFMSPDGLRMINFSGQVSPPIGANGQGKVFPFLATLEPTRMVSACNGSEIRISSADSSVIGSPTQEWVYDLVRNLWHGPHTFKVSLVEQYGTDGIIAPVGLLGLWRHSMITRSTSTYVENGAAYNCVYQTAYLPERSDVEQLSVSRAVFYRAFGAGMHTFSVSAVDARGDIIDFASIQEAGGTTLWDEFVWGAALWLGTSEPLSAIEIPWNYPVVFDRMALRISVDASAGLKFAHAVLVIESLGYTVLKR